MTTSSGISAPVSMHDLLVSRGYRKITNGCWESSGRSARVYAFGQNPLTDWKVFHLESDRFQPVADGMGSGVDSLKKFLIDNSL